MSPRLSPASAEKLSAIVKRHDGARPSGPRIVHLGLGAFARAHLAAFTDDANDIANEAWQIVGVSLQRPDMRDQLKPQDGLYTLVSEAVQARSYQLIKSVREVLVAAENPAAIVALMSDPTTHIISLTVTEKGYCHLPASGKLDRTHPDIHHDLATPSAPRSAIGFLVAAADRRRRAGAPPFTVLTCDNLPSNGHMLRELVLEFASLRDFALAQWIAQSCAFPSTMVDRIVPATTKHDIAQTEAALGVWDAAPVMAEPFRQWVIEDHFASKRPAWEQVGAQLVDDVAPYELMKLRLLNGAHSTLAYLGYLAGYETVADASADPLFAKLLERLWAEIIPTVPAPDGVDLNAYTRTLLARFQNPAIRHRTWQIAMDGSQKLPQRLLSPLRERLSQGAPIDTLALSLAGWMRYVMGRDEHGQVIEVRDPLWRQFRDKLATTGTSCEAVIDGLLAITAIFGDDLRDHQMLRHKLIHMLDKMIIGGVKQTLAAFVRT